MKHLKTFEKHAIEETNEFWGAARKFATGHESGDAKNAKKAEIEASIEKFVELASEDGWSPEKIERKKNAVLKAASDNNWRGFVKVGRSSATGGIYCSYQEKWSDLQALGAAAAGTHSGNYASRP